MCRFPSEGCGRTWWCRWGRPRSRSSGTVAAVWEESHLLHCGTVKVNYLNGVDEVKFLRISLRFDLTYVAVTVHDVPGERDLLDVGRLCYQSWQIHTESKKPDINLLRATGSSTFWERTKIHVWCDSKLYKVCMFHTFEAFCEFGAALHNICSDGGVRTCSLQQTQYLDVHLAWIQMIDGCQAVLRYFSRKSQFPVDFEKGLFFKSIQISLL